MEAGPDVSVNRERLVSLAARESAPVMYEWPEFVAEGGLISYGTDPAEPGGRPVSMPPEFSGAGERATCR